METRFVTKNVCIMMTYKEIQDAIDSEFEKFLKDFLSLSDRPKKYFYWTEEFFKIEGNLSFQYYPLTKEEKDEINKLGSNYFKESEISFIVELNSHRNNIIIKNITKLFSSENLKGQKEKYEYIKEYIQWKLLQQVKSQNKQSKNLEEKTEIQRRNFLITYISYLCEKHKTPIHPLLKDNYINYSLTNQVEDLNRKLDKNIAYRNEDLRKKIERLHIYRKDENKIYFVFSRAGGREKEELRELLEVMGKPDTGNMYRGQANSSWKLNASITREKKYAENEADMYYEILSLKPDAFQYDKTVYERLITMQHYGMPTRLLDITRNPLIAIFFACNNWECRFNDGAIFTFKPPETKKEFLNLGDKRLESLSLLFEDDIIEKRESKNKGTSFLSGIAFIKGIAKNQRISNQCGDFIFVGTGEKIEEKLDKRPEMIIIIDSKTKKVLLEQLESLNIHGGTVYPDLAHMSSYIKNKYSIESKKRSTTEEFQKNKSKEESATSKIKKEESFRSFDLKTLKDKNKDEQITLFAKHFSLDKEKLTVLIEHFLFSEKEPFKDEVAKTMLEPTSILKESSKIESLRNKITELALNFKEEKA